MPDHGVAGPTRRYTLIVAMLVTLAAVPTAGLLAAGAAVLDEGEGPPPGEPPHQRAPGGHRSIPPVVVPDLPAAPGGSPPPAVRPPAPARPAKARMVRHDDSGAGPGRMRRNVADRGGVKARPPVPPPRPVSAPPPAWHASGLPVPPPAHHRRGTPARPVPPAPAVTPQQRDRRHLAAAPSVPNQRLHRHQDRAGYPVGRTRGRGKESGLPRR